MELVDIKGDLHEYKWSSEPLAGSWLNNFVYCMFFMRIRIFRISYFYYLEFLFSHRCMEQELATLNLIPFRILDDRSI